MQFYKQKLILQITAKHLKCPHQIGHSRYMFMSTQSDIPLQITQKGPVTAIVMDRPAKKNAMNDAMWRGLTVAISEADVNPSTNIITIAGNPEFFSAGTDLTEFMDAAEDKEKFKEFSNYTAQRLVNFATALIYCKKPIVALVHGRAIGIGVTLLPLCDIVYASDKATFNTPFANLGIAPECCSSYTFPKIMGYARAAAVLYQNKIITAQQAHDWGLVSQVIHHDKFIHETSHQIDELAKLPIEPLLQSKWLVREQERKILDKVCREEAQTIAMLRQTTEMTEMAQQFLARKVKK